MRRAGYGSAHDPRDRHDHGADAVYLTTAAVAGSTLLTLDQELLDRAPPDVRVMTPEAWLASSR